MLAQTSTSAIKIYRVLHKMVSFSAEIVFRYTCDERWPGLALHILVLIPSIAGRS